MSWGMKVTRVFRTEHQRGDFTRESRISADSSFLGMFSRTHISTCVAENYLVPGRNKQTKYLKRLENSAWNSHMAGDTVDTHYLVGKAHKSQNIGWKTQEVPALVMGRVICHRLSNVQNLHNITQRLVQKG